MAYADSFVRGLELELEATKRNLMDQIELLNKIANERDRLKKALDEALGTGEPKGIEHCKCRMGECHCLSKWKNHILNMAGV